MSRIAKSFSPSPHTTGTLQRHSTTIGDAAKRGVIQQRGWRANSCSFSVLPSLMAGLSRYPIFLSFFLDKTHKHIIHLLLERMYSLLGQSRVGSGTAKGKSRKQAHSDFASFFQQDSRNMVKANPRQLSSFLSVSYRTFRSHFGGI